MDKINVVIVIFQDFSTEVATPSEMRRVIATRNSLGLFETGDTKKKMKLVYNSNGNKNTMIIWLVVSTPLKNIRQIGSSSQRLGKKEPLGPASTDPIHHNLASSIWEWPHGHKKEGLLGPWGPIKSRGFIWSYMVLCLHPLNLNLMLSMFTSRTIEFRKSK